MGYPPPPFFGVATAAYQIEGAVREGGRGESIWDRFSHLPGRTAGGDTGDVACDHFHRWREDLDLLAEFGVESYRFSIAWPRIQAAGRGPANPQGLAFYRALASGLRERGIEPVATLYHWDLPQALQDGGGWAHRDTAQRFAEYAAICGDALADLVGAWITHNEPWVTAIDGHATGRFAPGIADWRTALRVAHHLLLSHGLAAQALRQGAGGTAPVGISLNLIPAVPASDRAEDAQAATLADGAHNRWFLDPLLRGAYPADMVAHYAPALGEADHVLEGDLGTIAEPLDFLGINYYFPQTVAADPVAQPLGFRPVKPRPPLTAMGWPQDAGALCALLLRLRDEHPAVPLWITENGAAFDDEVIDGAVRDDDRIAYLRDHLAAAEGAISAGADVRRYFVWSFMDNFEWAEGYAKRFGLVRVDYDTQRRIPKASARWYTQRISAVRGV